MLYVLMGNKEHRYLNQNDCHIRDQFEMRFLNLFSWIFIKSYNNNNV